jgi:hypothetical protein
MEPPLITIIQFVHCCDRFGSCDPVFSLHRFEAIVACLKIDDLFHLTKYEHFITLLEALHSTHPAVLARNEIRIKISRSYCDEFEDPEGLCADHGGRAV